MSADNENLSELTVDPALVAEFIDKQKSDLDEIEFLILKLETPDRELALADIRRLIHTCKGEAGVLQLEEIQKVCHVTESYLDRGYHSRLVDRLLHAIDWLATHNSILAGKTNVRIENADTLIARIFPDLQIQVTPVAKTETAPTPKDNPLAAAKDFLSADLDSATPVVLDDAEFVNEYLGEARDHLQAIEQGLLALECTSNDAEAVNTLLRSFHTIKGGAGMLGFPDIQGLAHGAESLMSLAKRGVTSADRNYCDLVLVAADKLRNMLAVIEKALQGDKKLWVDRNAKRLCEVLDRYVAKLEGAGEAVTQEPIVEKTPTQPSQKNLEASLSTLQTLHPAAAAEPTVQSNASERTEPRLTVRPKEMVKVDTELLDRILDTIGELVIAESMVHRDFDQQSIRAEAAHRNMRQLAKITRELQQFGTSLRMTSLKPLFGKMARLARDVAQKIGKDVRFHIEGEDTELDRSVVESIGDPLVHMIRNCIDHGIETIPADRTQCGKTAHGNVTLRAYHQGGNVFIQIRDDGRGLNREAILNKGIEKGLVAAGSHLSDEDVFGLIFLPGFSTASALTDLSGRGVGMDVVKKNVEALRGQIKITSEPGLGSSFTIVLPLTLAIIDAMIVRVGSERYLLPTISVRESLQVAPEQIHKVFGRGESLLLRDQLVPVYRLKDLFGVPATAGGESLAVIVENAGRRAALLVDRVHGQQQIVIKNLGALFRGFRGISGGAILSDGSVGLIVDVASLIGAVHESFEDRQPAA